MEEQRFDRLARIVATRGSRRRAVATLATGLLAVWSHRRPAAAAEFGPGQACTRTNQCYNAYASRYVCDDNNFDYDGPTNCCTYEWGGCGANEHCCGVLSCIDGTCRYFSQLAGAGKGCWRDADCDPGSTGLYCDFNDWDNSSLVCCHYAGGSCQYNGHCCGSLACIGGICT